MQVSIRRIPSRSNSSVEFALFYIGQLTVDAAILIISFYTQSHSDGGNGDVRPHRRNRGQRDLRGIGRRALRRSHLYVWHASYK